MSFLHSHAVGIDSIVRGEPCELMVFLFTENTAIRKDGNNNKTL